MRITEARYIVDDVVEVIALSQMTTHAYENIYQGKLYCPTERCTAKIVYSGGMRPYYRTWNHDNHLEDCIHAFTRLPIRRSGLSDNIISVDISYERRQNALKEAAKLMELTEEELAELKAQRASRRNTASPRPRTDNTAEPTNVTVSSTLAGGDITEENGIGYRGRNISKRYVDTISESDIGEIRLVMGRLDAINSIDTVADLFISRNGIQIKVVFEEAFIAEPTNNRYLNSFNFISQYLEQHTQVLFAGIGEIRKNRRTESIELVIYLGTDFKINGKDMMNLGNDFVNRVV